MFEFEFVDWLRKLRGEHPNVEMGIGDDAAILQFGNQRFVLTTDLLCDGIHFKSESQSLRLVGRKTVAVSLSDVSAMGAKPIACVLDFCFPKSLSFEEAQQIAIGAKEIADEFGVAIVGGDTNRWDDKLVLGSTLLGTLNHAGWRVGGAKVGDRILVTGSLGGSILGKHLWFEPRCRLAELISAQYKIHAATDISDSLTIDLSEMCEQSGLGASLMAEQIPISAAAKELSRKNGAAPIEHALFDGEDFELIFAVDPSEADRMLADPKLKSHLTVIGEFTASLGLQLVAAGEVSVPLVPHGFEH